MSDAPSPNPSPVQDPTEVEAARMSLGEHLEELRTRVIRSLLALVVAALLCIWPARWLLVNVIARPVILVLERHGQPTNLLATGPAETLVIYIKVVLFCGALIASPYVLYQAWAFVASGLYRHEKDWVYQLVPVSVGLFLAGATFMYALVLMVSLNFLVGFSSWFNLPATKPNALERALLGDNRTAQAETRPADGAAGGGIALLNSDPASPPIGSVWINLVDGQLKVRTSEGILETRMIRADQASMIATHFRLSEYLTYVLILTLAFGFAFQIPLVVYFLVRSGIVSADQIANYRKVAIMMVVIFAGMIAPPDLLSHLLLAGPMIVLFEAGLLWSRRAVPKPAAAAGG